VQVAITTRHGGLSDRKREYISTKAQKLLTYFERTSIQVTVHFEKDRATVELLVNAEHKHNFVARDVGEDVLATFDQVLHKMEQQIRKYKEKIQDHRRAVSVKELAALSEAQTEGTVSSGGEESREEAEEVASEDE